MLQLKKAYVRSLGFDLVQAVADYKAAMAAHALTEGVPAPVAEPLVEVIAKRHAGQFEIVSPVVSAAAFMGDGTIKATIDGNDRIFPDDPTYPDRKVVEEEWVLTGHAIAAYVPTVAEVAAQQVLATEVARINNIKTDTSRANILTMLKTATPAQIDTWFVNNIAVESVTTLPQAKTALTQMRNVLSALTKLIATQLPES